MKLSQTQLRRLINEAVKRRFSEVSGTDHGADVPDQIAEFLIPAVAEHLSSQSDLVAGNAWEQMMGTLGEDDVLTPSRYEDIDSMADQVAQIVITSSELREELIAIARQVLSSLMEQQGTPGPGRR